VKKIWKNSIENYQNLLRLNNIIEKKFQKMLKISMKKQREYYKNNFKKNASKIK
jgi:hypothetical protein